MKTQLIRIGVSSMLLAAVATFGASSGTAVSLAGNDNVPGFDHAAQRAAALHLPAPKPADTPGYNACARALENAAEPACFKDPADVTRYIRKLDKASTRTQTLTLSGYGGVALQDNTGAGYAYAMTCERWDCNETQSHVDIWYWTSFQYCTHYYPNNDSYVNYVDHGFQSIYNWAYGPSGANCNLLGLYFQANQGGAGAQFCGSDICEATSTSYQSFSMHNRRYA